MIIRSDASGLEAAIQINWNVKRKPSFEMKPYIANVLSFLGLENGYFEFSFVTKPMIVALNQSYLNRTYVTDIISFNLGTPESIHGDIYICVDKARQNAVQVGHPLDQELKTLIVHGILHLLDYEDYSPEEKAKMFAEQDRILSALS